MKRFGITILLLMVCLLQASIVYADIYTDESGIKYVYKVGESDATVKGDGHYESDVFPGQTWLSGDITILDKFTVDGVEYTVTTIDRGAFNYCTDITGITIPKTITYIGRAAFGACENVTDVWCYANPNNMYWWEPDTYYVSFKPGKATRFHVQAGMLAAWQTLYADANVTYVADLEGGGDTPEETPLEGTCGKNLSWKATLLPGTLTVRDYMGNERTLSRYCITISGTGEMDNYETSYDSGTGTITSTAPWGKLEAITDVVIEDGVTTVGHNAFYGSGFLFNLTLPSTLKKIMNYSFYNTAIGSLDLPEGLWYVGLAAFNYCYGLRSLHIPASLTSFYDLPFINNINLETITVAEGNAAFDSRDNCNAIIRTSKNELITGCKNTVIPASVKTIGSEAFRNSDIVDPVIPEGVTKIGFYTFANCQKIENITLPNSLTVLNEAFDRCTNLKAVTIGNSLKTFYEKAFDSCPNLADVYCHTHPDTISWTGAYTTTFMPDKGTRFHVKAKDLATWQEKYGDRNVTFTGDLDGDEPGDDDNYGLYIGETPVTADNAADVLGNGQFAYDAETKTLTVKNATLENNTVPVEGKLGTGINNSGIDGLNICLEGTSTFTTFSHAIFSDKSFSITGNGTLNATSIDSCGVCLHGNTVQWAVNGPKVNATAETYFAFFSYKDNSSLTVEGTSTSLTLQSLVDMPTILRLGSLTLGSGVSITEPAGGTFSPGLQTITTDGTSFYRGKVVISGTEPTEPEEPEAASLNFCYYGNNYKNLSFPQDIADEFTSPTFTSTPADRKIIWRTNISEMPADGGKPIKVEVDTDPFRVRLLNTDGTGQTNVSVVAYDEYVTDMATLDISFYANVYEEPDTTTMGTLVEIANEEVIIDFGDGDDTLTEDTDLTNTEVSGVLFTLNEEEGDGYDADDESIVLNSTMTTNEVEAILERLKPGSGAFAAMFSGMTFLLPAGSGYFDVEFLTMGDHALTVKIGDNAAITFTQSEKGSVRIDYECDEDTYVYIYGSEADGDKARMAPSTVFAKHAPRHAEAHADAVKVYGFTVKSESVIIAGDINGDGKVDVSDYIGVANHILGVPQDGFHEKAADVNGDNKIDVSDYIGVANIILNGSPYGQAQ